MKKKWISAIMLFCSLEAFGQNFTWEAKLPVPDTTGYYHIAITPAVSARAYRMGNWDIRIFSGITEVPYVLNQDILKKNNVFKAFGMPLLEVKPKVATTVIFEPGLQRSLSEFGLRYTNTTVRKEVQLTASNDQITWYALRDPFLLNPSSAVAVEGKEILLEETIAIPASSFRYYKLVINDSASAPLQINCVGHRSIPQIFPAHTAVPGVTLKLLPGKDRREDDYLIDLHGRYPLTHLTIGVNAPAMYHRGAVLSGPAENRIGEFVFSARDSLHRIILPQPGAYDSIYLHIHNGDNPALELGETKAWQHTYYMIAHLEKGKNYVLKGGDARLHIPQYDVAHFREVYESLAQHMVEPEAPMVRVGPAPEDSVTFFKSRWWVWAGITFIIVLLGLVVFRMMKDMRKGGE